MSESAPRVTQPLLQHFSHRTVRLVGKVRQLRGEQAVIDADGQVTLHLHRDAHLQLNHAVEIIGKVQQDFSVRVMASENLGPEGNVDFQAIEAVVDATHRYSEIFYDKQD